MNNQCDMFSAQNTNDLFRSGKGNEDRFPSESNSGFDVDFENAFGNETDPAANPAAVASSDAGDGSPKQKRDENSGDFNNANQKGGGGLELVCDDKPSIHCTTTDNPTQK